MWAFCCADWFLSLSTCRVCWTSRSGGFPALPASLASRLGQGPAGVLPPAGLCCPLARSALLHPLSFLSESAARAARRLPYLILIGLPLPPRHGFGVFQVESSRSFAYIRPPLRPICCLCPAASYASVAFKNTARSSSFRRDKIKKKQGRRDSLLWSCGSEPEGHLRDNYPASAAIKQSRHHLPTESGFC